MMFRPTYCCNCGEKVERVEWHIWTSRRFCELCSTEYKHIDMFPFGAVGLGLLFVVFGISGFLRGNTELASPAKNEFTARSTIQQKPEGNTPQPVKQVEVNASKTAVPPGQNTEQPPPKQNSSEEAVFYCRALTKKGTPCTRRVKVKGYCWQHAKSGQITPTRF